MNVSELKELLAVFVEEQNADQIRELISQQHSIDIASALSEFDDAAILAILNPLDPNDIASIIEESEETLQKKITEILDIDKIIQVFTHMSPDDITDIMGILSINQRKELLFRMKRRDSQEIQMLLGFEADTAGGLMTTQYIALRQELSTNDALQKIKNIGPKTEVIEKIFVLILILR